MNNKNKSTPLIAISSKEENELKRIKERYIAQSMKIMDTNNLPIDLLNVYPDTKDLKVLYKQLSDLKKCLDSFRPFNSYQMENLQESFDTIYTYESNRIEGNTLTLMETSLIINKGLTISSKSLKDHLEAINHKQAIEFIRELVVDNEIINEKNIKLIHSLILQTIDRKNTGIYRRVPVYISGTDVVFPKSILIPKMMEELIIYYENNKNKIHPVKLASHMHAKLVNIHPFIDGNGRTSRLLMNFILLQSGYPITVIYSEENNRKSYYQALNQHYYHGKLLTFEYFIAINVKTWIFKLIEFLAPSIGEEEKNKGYYFFKKIEPYLDK